MRAREQADAMGQLQTLSARLYVPAFNNLLPPQVEGST